MKESGDILGVSEKAKTKNSGKAILAHILEELVINIYFLLTNIFLGQI